MDRGDWAPVNCGLGGNADVCKYNSDGDEDEDMMKKLDEWCRNRSSLPLSEWETDSLKATFKSSAPMASPLPPAAR
jgi:hypothetical protein